MVIYSDQNSLIIGFLLFFSDISDHGSPLTSIWQLPIRINISIKKRSNYRYQTKSTLKIKDKLNLNKSWIRIRQE